MNTPPHEVDEAVLGPFRYYNETPGKNVRGMLIDAFQAWLQISPDRVEVIKDIVSTLHNASLLVDDIEDNSKLRRGNPTAHLIFGIPATINTANYVYFIAMDKCLRLGNPEAMNVFIAELLNLHRGQGQELNWREHLKCPSEEQYTQMVQDKTGGLFRLAVGLMQAFSECKMDFNPLLNKLALYFQMRDDFLNLADASYMKSKSFCEDLTEGKFSFPIIKTIQADLNDNRLLSILKQRTEDTEVKKYAVRLMNEKGALHDTVQVLETLNKEVLTEINGIAQKTSLSQPILLGLLAKLHSQVEVVSKDLGSLNAAFDSGAAAGPSNSQAAAVPGDGHSPAKGGHLTLDSTSS